jgi:hypothetical protein
VATALNIWSTFLKYKGFLSLLQALKSGKFRVILCMFEIFSFFNHLNEKKAPVEVEETETTMNFINLNPYEEGRGKSTRRMCGPTRRKIRRIESNAKCCYLKN